MGEPPSSTSKSADVVPSEPRTLANTLDRPGLVAFLLGVLIALYIATALSVATELTDPIVDEPIYASSAYEFANSFTVTVSELSAPNAIFDAVWGGAFARIFGASISVLRASSVVLVALSAPFMYLLCRSLGSARSLALLGTAAYLFAPLAFTLSTTFQTDPHMMALVVMAAAVTIVGFQATSHQIPLLGASSALVSIAFLSRPQALVMMAAAVVAWFIWGPSTRRWSGIAALAFVPGLVFALHGIWINSSGEPFVRSMSRQGALDRTFGDVVGLGAQSLVGFFIYVGLFVIPLVPLLAGAVRSPKGRRVNLFLSVGLVSLGISMLLNGQGPFDRQEWITNSGLGAVDRSFLGSRPDLMPAWALGLLTLVMLGGAFLFLTHLQNGESRQNIRLSRRFVLLCVAGFTLAAFASALALQGRVFDRYWLPMLPLVIALAVGAGTNSRKRLAASVALVAVLGLVSVIGSRDAFSTYRQVNAFADAAVVSGVDPLALDGGASWSAAKFGLNDEHPAETLKRIGPYWLKFYAVNSRPEFAVALEPLAGYTVVARRPYDSSLHTEPTFAYLIQRDPELGFYVRSDDF